ncbi:hypothetical protein [Clostridium grantii]|uniref:Uncharacterized protein n=1 Tax=Clostridium grantii DSM 8605 TaxID=1121316 RepID=A0A1M5WSI0_9CLOT|nr:hypothetical protein [Clostridium grantii]SHH90527.1 hypothetical protein SAMN02745207_03085 [Clostridium grantii DSM 8605]
MYNLGMIVKIHDFNPEWNNCIGIIDHITDGIPAVFSITHPCCFYLITKDTEKYIEVLN